MRMVNGQCSMLAERAVELLCRLIETPRISREEQAAADLHISERTLYRRLSKEQKR